MGTTWEESTYWQTSSANGQVFATFTNDADYPVTLNALHIRVGTGTAGVTYHWYDGGDPVYSDGEPITLSCTYGTESIVITEHATYVETPSGSYPEFPDRGGYNPYDKTVPLDGTVVNPGSTAEIRFNVEGGTCFCFSGQSSWIDYSEYNPTVTATFNLNGGYRTGGGETTQSVRKGEWPNPPTVARDGFTHSGWSPAVGPINSDTTYTAQWTEWTYTVSYNANGGGNAPASQTKRYTQNLTLQSTSGMTAKSYAISFNANGGIASSYSKSVYCTCSQWLGNGVTYNSQGIYSRNENVVMQAIWVNPSAGTLPTATKDGYIFAGWFDGNGNRYISTSTVTGNLVLYAKWVTSPLWIKTAKGWERFLPPGTTVENIDYVWKFTGGKWQKIQPVYIRSNGQWIQLKGK